MYHGFDWYGRMIKVREDCYGGLSGPDSFRGSPFRGGGGYGGRGLRGGYRGGFVPSGPARDFSKQDLYAEYCCPAHGGLRIHGFRSSGYDVPTVDTMPSPASNSWFTISVGLPRMKISLRNSLKSSLMVLDPKNAVLSSLLRFKRRRWLLHVW
ncbi:hypothetical protein BDR04DRAFT_1108891 [Suillus decipiens]|nr:hypothetical protein BDR04DRAFT_1108891 [Suillus decipiens]